MEISNKKRHPKKWHEWYLDNFVVGRVHTNVVLRIKENFKILYFVTANYV